MSKIEFYDAFKRNGAPYDLYELPSGRIVKRYLNEAYASYMDVSEKTGRKFRWGVVADGARQSAYGYFGVTPGKNPVQSVGKLFQKMNQEQQAAFIRSVFEERFSNWKEAESWVVEISRKYNSGKFSDPEPEKYYLLVWGGVLEKVIDALVAPGTSELDVARERLRNLALKLN